MKGEPIERVELRRVVTLEKGKPPAQQPFYGLNSALYLTPEYLRGRSGAESVKPSANAVHVEDDDVIVLWDGSNAGEFFRGKRGILASTMCRVAHNDDFERDYFYYAIKNWEPYLKSHTSGSGIPHVDKEVLGTLEILRFAEPEQTKIADILSTVDRAIGQTEALIAKQQRINTGLMQDLLTRGIDEQGNLRSEHTHKFKDSPLKRIPEEWEVVTLDSISEFVTSGARGWAKYYSVEGAIFLRIGNLTRDHINLRFDDTVFVRPPKSAEGQRTFVMPGDLLISVTADLGIIGVIPNSFGKGFVNQHIALIRLITIGVEPRFIGWFLQGHGGQIQFEQQNESGAKAGLNLPTIRELLVAKPPKPEQSMIAEILDSNTSAVEEHLAELRKLHSLKTALMQDLLTGIKRVTPLLEQVAMN